MSKHSLITINLDFSKNEKFVFWTKRDHFKTGVPKAPIALPNSDPASFKVIDDSYFAVDKNQVYAVSDSAEGIQIWDDADIASLVFLPSPQGCSDRFADKHHLYYFNWHFIECVNHHIEREVDISEGTFKKYLMRHHPNPDGWWSRDNSYYENLIHLRNNAYHDGRNIYIFLGEGDPATASMHGEGYFSALPDADLSSFQSLDHFYSKDKNGIYHHQRQLKQADLATFESLGNDFAKDKHGIFYNGYLCLDADITSFEVINADFARDSKHLFSGRGASRIGKFKGYTRLLRALANSHPDSFEILDHRWAKDKNQVYCHGGIWDHIDAATFQLLFEDGHESWAKCKYGVYNANGRRTMKGVDGASFQVLNQIWGKDKNTVFRFDTQRIVSAIDAQSFQVVANALDNPDGKAYDKKYDYWLDELGAIKKKLRNGGTLPFFAL